MTRPPLVIVKRSLPVRAAQPHATDRPEFAPRQKPNPIAFAQFWLGDRLQERLMSDGSTSHFLDGSPSNLDAFMQEANRMASLAGQDMLSANPRWLPR